VAGGRDEISHDTRNGGIEKTSLFVLSSSQVSASDRNVKFITSDVFTIRLEASSVIVNVKH